MIVPYTVGPFTLRTAVWYQGESNVGQATYYDCAMTELVSSWRSYLPSLSTFGFIQIAACNTCYQNVPAADLRQAQLSPLRNLPKIAFATAIDLVYPFSGVGDIHPTNKQAISARLAASVLSIEYGLNTNAQSPFYAGAKASADGTTVTVTVSLVGCAGGCTNSVPFFLPPNVTAAQSAGFQIQTNDAAKTWLNASAVPTADGTGLILTALAPGLEVLASAYGRATWPVVTAYNALGLPVVPWCFALNGTACFAAGI